MVTVWKTRIESKYVFIIIIIIMSYLISFPIKAVSLLEDFVEKQTLNIGFNLVSWNRGKMSASEWEKSIQEMYTSGVRSFSIITYRFVDKNTGDIYKISKYKLAPPPSSNEILAAMKKGKELGMSVSLNPFIEIDNPVSIGNEWRGNLNFSGKKLEQFFFNYQNYIHEMAQIAREAGIDRLYIGSEIDALSLNNSTRSYWTNIIREMRAIFNKGVLTYAANHDNYRNIPFWNELDEIGIDAYFSLATESQARGIGNPSISTIKRNYIKTIKTVKDFSKKQKKPVVFSEWGVVPFDLTTYQPWNWKPSEVRDSREQLNAYNAVIDVSYSQYDWLNGIYFWHLGMPGNKGSNYYIDLDSDIGRLISSFL